MGWVICMNSQTGAGGMVILIAIKNTRLKRQEATKEMNILIEQGRRQKHR